MPRRSASFALTVAAAVAFAGTAGIAPVGAEVHSKLQLDLLYGHDSNPMELHEEGNPSAYTQSTFGAMALVQWTPRAGALLRASGTGRSHTDSLSEADRAGADVEVGLLLTPYRRADRRLSIALGGRGGLYRSTFYDPATGEVYAVTPDPNTQVEIPDRFDYNSGAAFLDMRWRAHRRVALTLDTEMARRRYVEDYARSAGLESLDDRSLMLEPGIRIDLSEHASMDLSYEWIDRRFDELDSIDEDAGAVPDTRRRYRYGGLRMSLSLDPTERWRFKVGARRTERSDLFAGYYDSTGTVGFAAAELQAGRRVRLGLDVSQRATRYANATVDGDPESDRRRGTVLRAAGRAETVLWDHVSFLVEVGADRSDDRDPLYQYDRNWAHAGLRFRR